MSCILRITSENLAEALQQQSLMPYRLENGTAHFQVSQCDFDDLPGQVQDAILFLGKNEPQIAALLEAPGAKGTLDFGVEVVISEFRFAKFPSDLVSIAGSLGLAMEVSQYPNEEAS